MCMGFGVFLWFFGVLGDSGVPVVLWGTFCFRRGFKLRNWDFGVTFGVFWASFGFYTVLGSLWFCGFWVSGFGFWRFADFGFGCA